MVNGKFYSVRDVARLTGAAEVTVYFWIRTHDLTAIKVDGRWWLVEDKALNEFVERRKKRIDPDVLAELENQSSSNS